MKSLVTQLPQLNYYFISSLLIIVILKCLLFPSLTTDPEVWAEAGSNYLPYALYSTYWQNLWATDAGYLPLLPRFLSVIIIKVFHGIEIYAAATQLIAIGFIALFSSIINFQVFRKLFPSDLLRFLTGISIAFIPDYELNTFINFTYFGLVPLLLFLFIDKSNMRNSIFWSISLFLFLIIMSKPHFIAFAPILFVMCIITYRKKLHRTLTFYVLCLMGLLVQIITLKLNPSNWGTSSGISTIIGEIVYSQLSIYKHVFVGDHTLSSLPAFLLFLIGLTVMIFFFVRKQLTQKNKIHLYFFITCNILALSTITMTILSVKAVFPPDMPFFGTPNDRHFMFANVAILLAGIIVIQSYIRKRWVLILVLSLILINSSAFAYFYNKETIYASEKQRTFQITHTSFDPYSNKKSSYSQWDIYNHLLNDDRYCIPINPFPSLITRNCEILHKFEDISIAKNKVETIMTPRNSTRQRWQVQAVVLINTSQLNKFDELNLVAFDKNNQQIGTAYQLTPDSSYEYVYYLFEEPVEDIATIKFFQGDNIYKVTPTLLWLGIKH